MKTEILEIITQHKYDHISSEQAVSELLDLYNVVGQSEQFFCCKEQINQRCSEQCLGCFQFQNQD